MLAVPGLGLALRTAATVDFGRSLAICQSAGIPILKGLELAFQGADEPVLQSAMTGVNARGGARPRPFSPCCRESWACWSDS